MNTDKGNKKGTQWQNIFLFHSFGFIASKEFIVDNDCKIIDDIIYGLKIFNKKDSKITLVSLTFFAEVYEKL